MLGFKAAASFAPVLPYLFSLCLYDITIPFLTHTRDPPPATCDRRRRPFDNFCGSHLPGPSSTPSLTSVSSPPPSAFSSAYLRSHGPTSPTATSPSPTSSRFSAFRSSPHARTPSNPTSPKQQLLAPNLGLESQDLAGDYEELASSMEGLGYLESGITDALNRFAATSNEWARIMRETVSARVIIVDAAAWR